MPQQKKKLSLDEARALFSDKTKENKPYRQPGSKPSNRGPQGNARPPAHTAEQIQEQIGRLERKVEHDSLTSEQESKILEEIGRLEEQLKSK